MANKSHVIITRTRMMWFGESGLVIARGERLARDNGIIGSVESGLADDV